MSGRKLLLALVFVIVVVLPLTFHYLHTKRWETSDAAYASWFNGGPPGQLTVRVRDRAGNPVAGASIGITNNSGGDGGTTDPAGVALIHPGEGDLEAMWLNGHKIIHRPHAYLLGTPCMSASGGLVVDVVMKR